MHFSTCTFALVPIVLLMLDGQAFAQQPNPSFATSGAARVFYEPDAYDVSFGIVTDDPDIQKCKTQHMATLKATTDFLAQNKEKVFSLKQEATKLETVYNDNARSKFYRFTTDYVARVKDPKALAPFQEGLITSGVTDIYKLDLFSEKLPELIDQARKQAIADAKHKAELAATELNWKLLGPRGIEFREAEYPWMTERQASGGMVSRAYNYDRNNRPELTTYVYSAVNLIFEYEPKNAAAK
jgi:uncharacterized protein YggE